MWYTVDMLALPTLLLSLAFAATYHVAADGDDSRSSVEVQFNSTPWASLDRLADVRFGPGDSILLRRGDVFRGGLVPRLRENLPWTTNLVIGAYGTGPSPVILGTVPVTGWKQSADLSDVWEADGPPGSAAARFFVDGQVVTAARYPASGWLPMESVEGDTAFVAAGLPQGDWTGAWVHLKSMAWNIDARRIASFRGGRVGLLGKSFEPLKQGWGYFVSGVPKAISAPGHWAQDSGTGKVWWRPRSAEQAKTANTELSLVPCGVDLRSTHDVTVQDLEIRGHALAGVCGEASLRLTVRRVVVVDADQSGIRLTGRDHKVYDSRVEGTSTTGIMVSGVRSVVLRDTVSKIGLLDRFGPAGFAAECCGGRGIHVSGDSSQILRNRVINTGWSGIWFVGRDTWVMENLVDSVLQTSNDGGGIYTYSKKFSDSIGMRNRIWNNVIRGAMGNRQGTPREHEGRGIYLDLAITGTSIRNNYLEGARSGVFLHNNRGDTVVGNMLVANTGGVFAFKSTIIPDWMGNNRVDSNFVLARRDQAGISLAKAMDNPQVQIDTLDNFLCREGVIVLDCYRHGARVWGSLRSSGLDGLIPDELVPQVGEPAGIWQGYPEVVKSTLVNAGGSGSPELVIRNPVVDPSQVKQKLVLMRKGSKVDSGAVYLYRFKAKASVPGKALGVNFLQANAPYRLLDSKQGVVLDTAWREYFLELRAGFSDTAARVDFALDDADSLIWISNVSWKKIDAARFASSRFATIVGDQEYRVPYSLPDANWRNHLGEPITKFGTVEPYRWFVAIQDTGRYSLRPIVMPNRAKTVSVQKDARGWAVSFKGYPPGRYLLQTRSIRGELLDSQIVVTNQAPPLVKIGNTGARAVIVSVTHPDGQIARKLLVF